MECGDLSPLFVERAGTSTDRQSLETHTGTEEKRQQVAALQTRYTLDMIQKALELRAKGIITF